MKREEIKSVARSLADQMVCYGIIDKNSEEYESIVDIAVYGAVNLASSLDAMPLNKIPYEIKEFLEDE